MNHQTSDTPETDAKRNDVAGAPTAIIDMTEHARKLERERDELISHFVKCHEAIGESPDSDKSELWKYFESFQTTITRLRVAEEKVGRMQALAGELIALIRVNVMHSTFDGLTIEQVDDQLKPWVERLKSK